MVFHDTLDIEGVVDSPGQYVFIVHYYSPDNPPVFTDVLVQNEKFADAMFHYFPSISGCRTIIVDRNTSLEQFRIEDKKYLLTFYANNTFQKGPIYIDYILPVPFESFTDYVFKPSPLGLANEFIEECATECKDNVGGRRCEKCLQGYWAFPECRECDCQQSGTTDDVCDDRTSKCLCKKNLLSGGRCDRCRPGTFDLRKSDPEYWLEDQGVPANRAQLMLTLLQRIQVKASYYERPSRAVLEHFQLEMAYTGAPTTGENGMDRPMASSVELCECPTAGPSCQECSPRYYRLPIQFGQLLGSCVPCKCNGHSGSCDPATGICLNCQHNTEGEHCEYCREDFYGNATTGSAAACIRCPCPHPIESNNFACSCSVSELGILERCECREGYIGDRCEMCNTGFFGNPNVSNGHCANCDSYYHQIIKYFI